MRTVLWLLGQFVIAMAGCSLMIAVVIAIWYGFSLLVLTVVGRLFPLRGRTPRAPRE